MVHTVRGGQQHEPPGEVVAHQLGGRFEQCDGGGDVRRVLLQAVARHEGVGPRLHPFGRRVIGP
jgi:hypothetical protein